MELLNAFEQCDFLSFQEFESPDESGSYTDYLKQLFLNSASTDFSHNEKQDLEAKVEPETPTAMGSPNGVSTTIISTEELHFPSSSNSESGVFPQVSFIFSYILVFI